MHWAAGILLVGESPTSMCQFGICFVYDIQTPGTHNSRMSEEKLNFFISRMQSIFNS